MLQTILVFVVIPAAIYGVLGLLTLRSKFGRNTRYRPGQPWEYEPVWFGPNPDGLAHHSSSDDAEAPEDATLGGARGSW